MMENAARLTLSQGGAGPASTQNGSGGTGRANASGGSGATRSGRARPNASDHSGSSGKARRASAGRAAATAEAAQLQQQPGLADERKSQGSSERPPSAGDGDAGMEEAPPAAQQLPEPSQPSAQRAARGRAAAAACQVRDTV